jgi:hypothetical protein
MQTFHFFPSDRGLPHTFEAYEVVVGYVGERAKELRDQAAITRLTSTHSEARDLEDSPARFFPSAGEMTSACMNVHIVHV